MQPACSENFAIFRLRHAHVRKDTRLSLLFCTILQAMEAWEQGYARQ